MTRIGTIRFTIGPHCKGASDFRALRRFGWKHTSTLALQRGIRLSKSAHAQGGIDLNDGRNGLERAKLSV
jgi:hypothetical protein